MDATERARLVERHLHLSTKAAALVFPRVSQHVEFDELVALANAGLAEAAQRFDPARGISFSTFAWYRVQGAIMDGMRRLSQLPRATWTKLVALRAASELLEHEVERQAGAQQRGAVAPTATEALTAMQRAMSAIRTMYLTSLEGARDEGFDAELDGPSVDERIDTHRLAARLREALATLPARERELMTKHYWEGKNLLEAGEELGISKSWASRLHAQAVERLRAIVDAET